MKDYLEEPIKEWEAEGGTTQQSPSEISSNEFEVGPPLLRVQVGDVIVRGSGRWAQVVMIVWTNRTYQPGHEDGYKATPVDAVCIDHYDGQMIGTALLPHFLTYLGILEYSDEEQDSDQDEYSYREGHTWAVNVPGYRRVTHNWWETFEKGDKNANGDSC